MTTNQNPTNKPAVAAGAIPTFVLALLGDNPEGLTSEVIIERAVPAIGTTESSVRSCLTRMKSRGELGYKNGSMLWCLPLPSEQPVKKASGSSKKKAKTKVKKKAKATVVVQEPPLEEEESDLQIHLSEDDYLQLAQQYTIFLRLAPEQLHEVSKIAGLIVSGKITVNI